MDEQRRFDGDRDRCRNRAAHVVDVSKLAGEIANRSIAGHHVPAVYLDDPVQQAIWKCERPDCRAAVRSSDHTGDFRPRAHR